MTFTVIKLFAIRFMVVCGVCLLLCNCGNKSALFLESPEITENNKPQTDTNGSEEGSGSKGEQIP